MRGVPNLFFFSGHGRDEERAFCDPPESRPGCRRRVPKDTTLVTVSDAGDEVTDNTFRRLMGLFSKPENEPALAHPIEARGLAQAIYVPHINVYPAGAQMRP